MDFTVPKFGLTSLERRKISVLFSLVNLFPTEILFSYFLLIFLNPPPCHELLTYDLLKVEASGHQCFIFSLYSGVIFA